MIWFFCWLCVFQAWLPLFFLVDDDDDDGGDNGTDDGDLPVKVLFRLVWAGKKIITKETRLSQVDLRLEIIDRSVVPKVAYNDAIPKITRCALFILDRGTIPTTNVLDNEQSEDIVHLFNRVSLIRPSVPSLFVPHLDKIL